jgi:DNA-binding response OmpR family regulator
METKMRVQTVLVVEADPSIRTLFDDVLGAEGYRVQVQEQGALSVEHVAATHPDLLVLELMTGAAPGMLALIEALRQRPATAAVPIIVSTTSPLLLEQHGVALRRLGCRVLLKPFALDCFLEMVSQQLVADAPAFCSHHALTQ